MRLISVLAASLMSVAAIAGDYGPTTVTWQSMGNTRDAKGKGEYVQRFTVTGNVPK